MRRKHLAIIVTMLFICGIWSIPHESPAAQPPYFIYGYAYDTDGVTPLPGIVITLTNLATGDEVQVDKVTTSTGYYQWDISGFPNGYADGQVIKINITHEGETGSNITTVDTSHSGRFLNVTLGTFLGNKPPTIELIEPDGIDDFADESYTILWSDSDPDDNATITLFYDLDMVPGDEILIGKVPQGEDSDNNTYVWNTSSVPTGEYYINASIYDGICPHVFVYSPGTVRVAHAPELTWTGEENYETDGLHPEVGQAGITTFVYRINYKSVDNRSPAEGNPKVHILKAGSEIDNSPFSMEEVDDTDTDYVDGKLYTYSTSLAEYGDDYTYYFTAIDSEGLIAEPTAPIEAPHVTMFNQPPTLTLLTPPAEGAEADTSFIIRWLDNDPDDNATISFYYDLDNIPGNETYIGLVPQGEDSENNSYYWDISEVPEGAYYINGSIFDGTNPPIYTYSPGKLRIRHAPIELPIVVGVYPQDDATNVPVGVNITISFSKPIKPTTLNSETIIVKDITNNASTFGTISYDDLTATATFDPLDMLEFGSEYRVTIRGGSDGVCDIYGNSLDGNFNGIAEPSPIDDYAWRFFTTVAENGTIMGKVRSAEGNLSGALVQVVNIENPSLKYTNLTDINGNYSIEVPEGTYNVTASKSGYENKTKTVHVLRAGITFVNFTLSRLPEPLGTILGYVTTKDGEPLEGVKITIENKDISVLTDHNGFYTINITAGTYNLTASKKGYKTVTEENVIVEAGKTTTKNFVLTKLAVGKQEVGWIQLLLMIILTIVIIISAILTVIILRYRRAKAVKPLEEVAEVRPTKIEKIKKEEKPVPIPKPVPKPILKSIAKPIPAESIPTPPPTPVPPGLAEIPFRKKEAAPEELREMPSVIEKPMRVPDILPPTVGVPVPKPPIYKPPEIKVAERPEVFKIEEKVYKKPAEALKPEVKVIKKPEAEKRKLAEIVRPPTRPPIPTTKPLSIDKFNWGTIYMVKEKKANRSIEFFKGVVAAGGNGLCISRTPSKEIMAKYQLKDATLMWLTRKIGDGTVPPSPERLSALINKFIAKKDNCIVLLDGIEFLTTYNKFSIVLKFIDELKDTIVLKNGILILPIDPSVFGAKELSLLEKNTTEL